LLKKNLPKHLLSSSTKELFWNLKITAFNLSVCKEIASELGFEDEFYFSRYLKNRWVAPEKLQRKGWDFRGGENVHVMSLNIYVAA
jgi:hypothetical protein